MGRRWRSASIDQCHLLCNHGGGSAAASGEHLAFCSYQHVNLSSMQHNSPMWFGNVCTRAVNCCHAQFASVAQFRGHKLCSLQDVLATQEVESASQAGSSHFDSNSGASSMSSVVEGERAHSAPPRDRAAALQPESVSMAPPAALPTFHSRPLQPSARHSRAVEQQEAAQALQVEHGQESPSPSASPSPPPPRRTYDPRASATRAVTSADMAVPREPARNQSPGPVSADPVPVRRTGVSHSDAFARVAPTRQSTGGLLHESKRDVNDDARRRTFAATRQLDIQSDRCFSHALSTLTSCRPTRVSAWLMD